MFRRVLIANRGEVAARVLRTCRRLGISCVAVASEADRALSWLDDADEVVCIGPARASLSYLDQDAILEAADRTGATAVHPGWGFLAENATFARRCEAAGLAFVGPPPQVIDLLGDKIAAREAMGGLGIPLIPGSTGRPLPNLEAAATAAQQAGYPVLLKAVAGGGGRGMRRVDGPDSLEAAWNQARAEAQAAFGDARMYLEKLIIGGRHIEFQVLVDSFGHAVHLGERECSIQRRHQKLLEETPSMALDSALRDEMGTRVAQALTALGYRSAGTVEMLRDRDGKLWFLEVNTRLQVEHPITEAVTGLDLVEWQLRIAAGQRLGFGQADVAHRGAAIELRLNAEDPENGFRPSPGAIRRLVFPSGEGVRVDSHLREGDAVSPHYDSMVAKLIAHGDTREQALDRAAAALEGLTIEGIDTKAALLARLLASDALRSGVYDTTTLEEMLEREAK